MTWSAPIERAISRFLVLHTAVTSAPNDLASCTAKLPPPPPAPWLQTPCPRPLPHARAPYLDSSCCTRRSLPPRTIWQAVLQTYPHHPRRLGSKPLARAGSL